MAKHYSKYDFHDDKVEVCEGLTAEKLKELGFFTRNTKWKIWTRNRKCSTKVLQTKWTLCKENNRYRASKTYGVIFNGINKILLLYPGFAQNSLSCA